MLRAALAAWPELWALPRHAVAAALLRQRGRYALWLPVCMGSGTLFYFSLRAEPPGWAGIAVLLPALAGALLLRSAASLRAAALRGALLAVAAAGLGVAAAQLATLRAAPVEPLPPRAAWLTGTVIGIETLPIGTRVTLGAVRVDGAEAPLSRTVRIRLRDGDNEGEGAAAPGDMLRLRAMLRAPAPPAYPGAWDLQRDAFFAGICGYGFALGFSERVATGHPAGFALWVQALRDAIARRIEAVLPVDQAGIAATLLTGNPSAIPAPDRAAFRDSGLAHLLAVAGLHIGIVMGFAMAVTRLGLALSERAALHWPCKQVAAVAALTAGGSYMLLTGMHVPIIRSFAMACLFTLAVVAGRRAISMRGLALAAAVLILTEPAQVPGVSFQMSFSAVLVLIAGYEALRPNLHRLYGNGAAWRRIGVHVAGLALTSLLAGTASAPFGAYHFGRWQLYFIPSNMIAVPLTAFWVMPAGLIALLLMPLHLEALALVPMGWGIVPIVWVARVFAALPAATLPAAPIPDWGMIVLSLGMAWLGLWRGKVRLAGFTAIAVGLASPVAYRPPDLLVSADARLIGFRTPTRVYVEEAQGAASFTLDEWTQLWGLPAVAMPARGTTAHGAVTCDARACLLRPAADAPAALLARGAVGPSDCAEADVLVSAEPARRRCPSLTLVDRFTVWRQGAAAVWLEPGGVRLLTDREHRGVRPWVPPEPRPRAAR